MKKRKRATLYAKLEKLRPSKGASPELSTLEPDDLRNRIQRTVATLGEADSQLLRQRLLNGLAKVGVHLGSLLFLLGIPATSVDELTPSDIGKVLRYIRINSPVAIAALEGLLAELLVGKQELAYPSRTLDKAALAAPFRSLARAGGKTKKVAHASADRYLPQPI